MPDDRLPPPRVLDETGALSRVGRVVSVNVSSGGVPKLPVDRARVSPEGVEGDRQRFLQYHGGPERAVSIYSLDLIEALRNEGHPIGIGTTGENLTLAGEEANVWVQSGAQHGGQGITGYQADVQVTAPISDFCPQYKIPAQ